MRLRVFVGSFLAIICCAPTCDWAASNYAFTTIVNFGSSGSGAAGPTSGLTVGPNGTIYGVGYVSTDNQGAVFRLNPTHLLTILGTFSVSNGAGPGRVLIDSNGNIFGGTDHGGASNLGVIFQIPPGAGQVTVLNSLTAATGGAVTNTMLVEDSTGNLYGAAQVDGGGGFGTVFKVTSGTNSINALVSFTGANGKYPQSIVADSQGNLYGVTAAGGPTDSGTIFKYANNNTLITLASFNGTNGQEPAGALFRDANGDLFGATQQGGAFGQGSIFELAAGSSTITPLVSFNGTDGAVPNGGLYLDSAGNIFGTTQQGGSSNFERYLSSRRELMAFKPWQPSTARTANFPTVTLLRMSMAIYMGPRSMEPH